MRFRIGKGVQLAIILFAGFLALAAARGVCAAKIGAPSDALSRSKVGVLSNHFLSFVTLSGVPEGATVTVAFPVGFNAVGLNEDDVDLNDNGLALTTAPDCSGTEKASIVRVGNLLTATICPGKGGAIAAGHTLGFAIGTNAVGSGFGTHRITNPPAAGSYKIAVAGSFGDYGDAPVAINTNDEINVTACVGSCAAGQGGGGGGTVLPSTPPIISNIAVDEITASTARMSWTTDQNADSYALYGINQFALTQSVGNGALTIAHSLTLFGLLPNQLYYFELRSTNLAGDVGWSPILSFTTLPPSDLVKPQISNVRLVSVGPDEAQIAWDTNIPTYWQLDFGKTVYYGTTVYGSDLAMSHLAILGNLEADRIYHYQIMAIGENGLRAVTPDLAFRTYDNIPPKITDITAENVTLHSFDLVWKTDEQATGGVKYGTSTSYSSGEIIESGGFSLEHRASFGNLAAGTAYHLRIFESDLFGNDAQSDDQVVWTLFPEIPPNVSDLKAEGQDQQIALSWTNPVSPGFSHVVINRSDDHYPQNQNDGTTIYSGAGESFIDTGLVNGRIYYYTVWAVNEFGQASSGAIVAAAPIGKLPPVNANANIPPPPPPPSGGICPIHLVPLNGSEGSMTMDSSKIIVHVEEVLVAIMNGEFVAVTKERVRITVPEDFLSKPVARATLRVGDNEYVLAHSDTGASHEAKITAPTPGVYPSAMLIEYSDKTSAYSRWQMKVEDAGHIYFLDLLAREPLEGVAVTLFDQFGRVWNAAEYGQTNPIITGSSGAYSFYVPKGEYALRIEKPGYKTLLVGLGAYFGPINNSYYLKPKNLATRIIMKAIGIKNFAKLKQISYCSFPWLLLIIIVLYIIYRFNKRKKEQKPKKPLKS